MGDIHTAGLKAGDIPSLLQEHGSRGIIFGNRLKAAGHMFNAINIGGTILYPDYQIGDFRKLGGFDNYEFLKTN